jgi:hypothetical protein
MPNTRLNIDERDGIEQWTEGFVQHNIVIAEDNPDVMRDHNSRV